MNIVYGLGVAAIVALSFFSPQPGSSGRHLPGGRHAVCLRPVRSHQGPVHPGHPPDGDEQLHGPDRGGSLERKELPDNGNPPFRKAATRRRWSFRNVRFSYGEKRRCSTTFPSPSRSTMAALVGPSGGGKSHDGEPPSGPVLGRRLREGAGAGQGCRTCVLSRPDGPYLHGIPAGCIFSGHHLQ